MSEEKTIKYKAGDVVLFKKERPDTANARGNYGWIHEMDRYLGRVCTIKRVIDSTKGFIQIEEDTEGLTFGFDCIEKLVTEEEIEALRIEEELQMKEFHKRHKDKTYLPDSILAIAVDVFGEDRVELNKENEQIFNIVIKFPEVELTNSKGGRHTVKELYVRVGVGMYYEDFDEDENTKAGISLEGIRSAWTLKEWETRYSHSHLPSYPAEWHQFCLGSSAFRLMIADLGMSLSEDGWTAFFLSLPNYIKWESLEGGPHMRMETIAYRNSVSGVVVESELKRIAGGLPKETWQVTNESMFPVSSSHPGLVEYFNENSRVRSSRTYDEATYKAKKEGAEKEAKSKFSALKMKWKGKKVVPEILEESAEVAETVDKTIIEYYCKTLGERGTKFLKEKRYKDARSKNRDKAFGEAGTI